MGLENFVGRIEAQPVPLVRRERGRVAALSGLLAEDVVQRLYLSRGATLLASRWRSPSGEIDLIFREGDDIVFVEVKSAATHAIAAERLGRAQMRRICQAALEYCDRTGHGGLCSMRFDLALVDRTGRVDLLFNAFGEN
ncbi:YraN family protein [Paracoccus bogoriensis]|uniref:YraN family protein n=1 Tax=Paracoccus bogoriensis TaxID=242065 RepID=UPI001CA52701|nr:YraN family protein [Paracoccus bogoriensis]MBW7055606.1 YraN family protein [Paracoccus bogoriensis]